MTPYPKKQNAESIRLRKMASEKEAKKIVAITAYDYSFARLLDETADLILVGDSLGMVMQGEENTLSVTLENIIYHSKSVAKAIKQAHLVADMPFLSYQINSEEALRNAGRIIAEGKAEAVKLEGGVRVVQTVEKLVEAGIPVMGHIGLTPQSVNLFGGYKIQGKSAQAQESLLQDAIALEEAGCYSLVLEGIPADLAKRITERIKIPTIGIGAGPFCDGQILVLQDLLGMNPDFNPRFLKKYADLAHTVQSAVQTYAKEVRESQFPDNTHSFYVNSELT